MESTSTTRPESTVGSACQALISTADQVSTDVTNFVRRCRSARTDLAPVTRELSELQMVLQLLNDFEAHRSAVPEELQAHLRPIMANCIGVVVKVHDVLRRQEVAGWTVEARDEVGELAKSLGVHRGVMGVVADLISVLVARDYGHGHGRGGSDEYARIDTLLGELQALGSSLVISYSNATLAREHFALQVHLGQIVTYTETLAPRTDLWQDAVRTLDDKAQETAGYAAAVGVRNSGLENLLPPGSPGIYDENRPPSMFFTPKRTADPKPSAEIESAGPSGTGFIVMDGFINSAQNGAGTNPTVPYYGDVQQASSQHLTVPGSEPQPSQRNYDHRNSTESFLVPRPISQHLQQPIPSTVQESASGLQVLIPDEKELAEEDVVSDEALAFAQVPIHVLDRLSVNLVGHVYGGSPSTAEEEPSGSQSHSTTRTSQDENVWDRSDAVSASTNDTDGLRDGHVHVAKVHASAAASTTQPNTNSQPPSRSPTPLGHHHQQQQLLPASHPLALIPSNPASQAASQPTDDSNTISNSRPVINSHQFSPHLRAPSNNGSSTYAGHNGLREIQSASSIKTINTQSYMSQKPLPRAPLVYIPGYPGPFIKKKVVVVGNFSCGKTCLIT